MPIVETWVHAQDHDADTCPCYCFQARQSHSRFYQRPQVVKLCVEIACDQEFCRVSNCRPLCQP